MNETPKFYCQMGCPGHETIDDFCTKFVEVREEPVLPSKSEPDGFYRGARIKPKR